MEELVIPDGIKTIHKEAFRQCSALKTVVIPDSVTYIGPRAFYGCKNLSVIKLGKNLKHIGTDAFSSTAYDDLNNQKKDEAVYLDNYLLKAVDTKEFTIKDGTTAIAASAFENCNSVETVHFPKSMKYISEEAFWGCDKLTAVDFNEGLKEIGANAFYRCDSLTDVTIPKTVTKIGEDAFGYYYASYPDSKYGCRTSVKHFTIKSYTNTAAEKYAKNNKFKFSSVFLATPTVKITAGKKQIKVNYTEADEATGFQVKYTKGKKSTTKTFKTTDSAVKTIKGLAKGKYKVQVRAYSESGKNRIYSSWTTAKAVTVK